MPYDQTQLRIFQTCPEKYRLTFVEQLERVTDQPTDQPLKFGAALHAGLAAWYNGLGTQAVGDCFLAKYSQPVVEGERLYTPKNGLQTLQDYLQAYGKSDKHYKVLAVETPVTLLLKNSIEYLVKLDTVVEDEQGVWVVEHKSTAQATAFTDSWWAQFEPNSQVSGQVIACTQQYGRCDGVILNGIALSYGVRKGFEARFERQVFQRTEEQLEDWRRNTLLTLDRLALNEKSPASIWEKNEVACRWCPFRPLCLSVHADGVREACYTKVENPLAYQREEV